MKEFYKKNFKNLKQILLHLVKKLLRLVFCGLNVAKFLIRIFKEKKTIIDAVLNSKEELKTRVTNLMKLITFHQDAQLLIQRYRK